ncbi:MAG: glycosyltransferase family 4 protein, partial [Anaerolineales bacterium]
HHFYKMHILLLTQILPYPPDAGPRIKTWHVLRYLVEQGYQVTLASFVRPEEEEHIPTLRKLCSSVHPVPIRRSRIADIRYWLRSHVTGRPFLIERDDSTPMREVVRKVLAEGVDVIHADQLMMTQFALDAQRLQSPSPKPPALVYDAHNAVWMLVERMGEAVPWFLRPVVALEARRIKRYEGAIIRQFDHMLAVTGPDRQALVEAARFHRNDTKSDTYPISVVPIAVDTAVLKPTLRHPGSTNILTLGTLHYPPNADGIRWFANEIFPLVRERVPDVTLTIVGKKPPKDIVQLGQDYPKTIEVTGYVPDLDPYMEQAAIMVVPVRAGGGMRVRILGAFARAMPVVTTSVGLEGIEARPGEDILVADTASDFAADVTRLLGDAKLQNCLAKNGRQLAETHYDWQVVLKRMNAVYANLK